MRILLITLLLLLASCGQNGNNKSVVQPQNEELAEQTTSKAEEQVDPRTVIQPSLGITPMQYKQQFNNASLMTEGSNFEITQMKIKQGDVFDTAEIVLSKNASMVIGITKQGLINSVTTIARGDGTMQSGADMLFLSAVMARAIHPNVDQKITGKIGLELFTQAGEANGKSVEKTFNNVKHFAMLSKELGYWYGTEAIKPENK